MRYPSIKNLLGFFFFISILLFSCEEVSSQTFRYSFEYDDAGNRTGRELEEIILKNIITDSISDASDDSSKEKLDSEISHMESIAETDLLFYPNPTHDKLIIEIDNFEEGTTGNIKVVSIDGRVVFIINELSEYIVLDFSGQEYGIYILNIQINDELKTYKVIKN